MCAQRRFRSDCAFAQSDQNLHWAHFWITKDAKFRHADNEDSVYSRTFFSDVCLVFREAKGSSESCLSCQKSADNLPGVLIHLKVGTASLVVVPAQHIQ